MNGDNQTEHQQRHRAQVLHADLGLGVEIHGERHYQDHLPPHLVFRMLIVGTPRKQNMPHTSFHSSASHVHSDIGAEKWAASFMTMLVYAVKQPSGHYCSPFLSSHDNGTESVRFA